MTPLSTMRYPAAAFAALCLAAATARANPPVYPYDQNPTPIVKREKALAQQKLPADLGAVPRVSCPIYVMEFHIWWRSPYGLEGRPGYGHWDVNDDVDTTSRRDGGADWMRDSRHVGYPLPGLYNSEDEGILRWQLRCLHNTGVDGVFVQMYPEWDKGDTFVGDAIFARILRIAGEEGVKIGVHDEVAFRQGRLAQNPEVMAKRAGEFLKRFGNDPAFLRINGKPAYGFQYWNRWDGRMTDDQLVGVFKAADAISGQPTFWMPFHGPDDALYSRPEIPGLVADGDSNMLRRNVTTFYPSAADYSIREMDGRLAGYAEAMKKHPDKYLGMWAYPGFDDSDRPDEIKPFNWMPRRGGRSLVEKLRRYDEVKPNFIMLSSWNDWEENTAMEPGLSYDGYAGDPYLYCRILAAAKGKTFVPPPLPPRTSVDPWLWQKLYGVDAEPPQVTFTSNDLGNGCFITANDSGSGVRSIRVGTSGDAWAYFSGMTKKTMHGLSLPSGVATDDGLTLEPEHTVTFTIDPAVLKPTVSTTPAYIAVRGSSAASGWLEIRYPSVHDLVQYRGNDFDEPKFPVHATFDVRGGIRLSGVRRMLEFKRDALAPFTVHITWHNGGGGNAAKFRLDRLDLFLSPDIRQVFDPSKPRGTGGHTMTLGLPFYGPKGEQMLYATAMDNAGNTSAPVMLVP